MTQEQTVFILADQALNGVVGQIRDDQWAMTMPAWFQTAGAPADITLRMVINYHAYDEAWVPETLSGKPAAEATGVPTDRHTDLLGDDPKAAFAVLVEKGVAAVAALDDPQRITHLSYGDFSARDYLMHVTSFRGFRAYDLAKIISINTKLPDELVQGMWDEFSPHFDTWRAMGVFKPALPIPDGASLQDKLMLSVGRQI